MKKLQVLSFHLHWITLCCFLLPFFYDSCSNKKTEQVAEDTTVVTTIHLRLHNNVSLDSVSKILEDSIAQTNHHLEKTNAITIDTTAHTTEPSNQKDELLSETIIKKYPILKPILIPDTGIHTGLATIINTIKFLSLFAATITFLLLLISLLAKLIDKNAVKTFLLLEICAIGFLLIACPPFFGHDKLWGYWFCLLCISTLIILDAYIVYKQKRKEI